MSLRINSIVTDITAKNNYRQLGIVTDRKAKSTEKLSSGYKINRAADDAAGLSISEKMRRQIRGLHQSAENITDGIAFCQVAEGALSEINEMIHRMSELAIKAANGTEDENDRQYVDKEIQELKAECGRIFDETAFNEQKIWSTNALIRIGTITQPAVQGVGVNSVHSITNSNYDKLPMDYFTVSASEDDGISISWTDYNNKKHSTQFISWDDLKDKGYRFDISDYFGGPDGPNNDLYDNDGNPVVKHTIAFNPHPAATVGEIVSSINGQTINSIKLIYVYASWEGTDTSDKFHISGTEISYGAAYYSRHNSEQGYNFESPDDSFIEPILSENSGKSNLFVHPSAQTVEEARNDDSGWEFRLNMEGLGSINASLYNITYQTDDFDDEDKNIWWRESNGTKSAISIKAGRTLKSLMESLTGENGSLSKAQGGMNDGVATYTMGFRIYGSYSYGGKSNNVVGSLNMKFTVGQDDTEQTVLDRINQALNDTTILDISRYANNNVVSYFSLPVKTNMIDIPVYGGGCNIPIQAGPEADNVIDISYDLLNLDALGLQYTRTATQNDAVNAIDELKNAENTINGQRALFGAYQNRLENAYKVNKNSEENTQYAESQIRDTDMAEIYIQNARDSILQQAGQTMLAQANQNRQGVLKLLN